MDILTQIATKLGELMIEAEALLMDIRVLQFNQGRDWASQFVAMSACGMLIGTVIGWLMIVNSIGGIR